MAVQAVVCLGLLFVARTASGSTMLLLVGLAFSVSIVASSWYLTHGLRRHLHAGTERLAPSLMKVVVGSILMAGPVWAIGTLITREMGGKAGPFVAVVVAMVVGVAIFIGVQALWKTPELKWLLGGLARVRGGAAHSLAGEGGRD